MYRPIILSETAFTSFSQDSRDSLRLVQYYNTSYHSRAKNAYSGELFFFFRKQRRPMRWRVFFRSIQLLILFLRDGYTPPRTPRGKRARCI